MKYLALTMLCLTLFTGSAMAAGRLADVEIKDRRSGQILQVYESSGHWFVAGRPGNEYQVNIRNRGSGDLLAVVCGHAPALCPSLCERKLRSWQVGCGLSRLVATTASLLRTAWKNYSAFKIPTACRRANSRRSNTAATLRQPGDSLF